MEITERSDILQAASRIYAGCLASGKITPSNQGDAIRYSVHVAVALAQTVQKRNIFDEGGDVPFPW
ncbi:MAG: hypothetical protein WB783_13070 [Arenicellales bacterium]|jgi:hypothetical protein